MLFWLDKLYELDQVSYDKLEQTSHKKIKKIYKKNFFPNIFFEKKNPTFGRPFSAKNGPKQAFFGHFQRSHKKSILFKFLIQAKIFMSLLKQNIHFRPPCFTDSTPQPQKSIKSSRKSPPWPPEPQKPSNMDNFCEYLQTKASKDHF